MGKESEGRSPVIRRSSSVFPRPKDESFGNVIDPVEEFNRERESIQRGAGAPVGTHQQIAEAEKKQKDQEDKASEARVSSARKAAASQQIYVDGRLVTVYNVFDADGNPIQIETLGGYRTDGSADAIEGRAGLTPGQRREVEGRSASRQATFSVLGIEDVEQSERFIMSRGERLDEDGVGFYDTERGKAIEEERLTKRRNPRSPSQSNATNMMTVGGGVTWFRNLSRTDPDAYAEMVDLLVGSSYLDKEDARKSVYTRAVGRAFAYAAADAAENVKAGGEEDLRTFLQQIQGDVDGVADDDDYVPVNRSYIDPTALASTARSAAEELLGRSLSDEEAARFSSRFRGLEDGYYDQIDAAGRSKTGARVADPNATGQAEAFLRSPEYDAERTKQLTGNYMDAFRQLVGG